MNFEKGDPTPDNANGFWSKTGDLNAEDVILKPAEINWIQGESAAAAGFALGSALAPETVGIWLGFTSAIFGESTNFTPIPSPTTFPWAYGTSAGTPGTPDQCDAVIAYWNTKGRVRQPKYIEQLGATQPGVHPCFYARWHVSGQPKTITQYYLADKWGPNGYEGQAVTSNIPDAQTRCKDNPLRGNLLYDFDFYSLHDNGPRKEASGGGGQ